MFRLDWSEVKPRTVSRLEPEYIPGRRGQPPRLQTAPRATPSEGILVPQFSEHRGTAKFDGGAGAGPPARKAWNSNASEAPTRRSSGGREFSTSLVSFLVPPSSACLSLSLNATSLAD